MFNDEASVASESPAAAATGRDLFLGGGACGQTGGNLYLRPSSIRDPYTFMAWCSYFLKMPTHVHTMAHYLPLLLDQHEHEPAEVLRGAWSYDRNY